MTTRKWKNTKKKRREKGKNVIREKDEKGGKEKREQSGEKVNKKVRRVTGRSTL